MASCDERRTDTVLVSARFQDSKGLKWVAREEITRQTCKRNSLIPGPYAQAAPATWLPSDGRCAADHSEHASDARSPVPPPSRGFHPCENQQSCAEPRPTGTSWASLFYSTRIPLPVRQFLVTAAVTASRLRKMLHSIVQYQ